MHMYLNLVLWALPADLVEKLGLEGYILPGTEMPPHPYGGMLSDLLELYEVENREIVACLVPGTTFPTEYTDGCPTRFVNVIQPEMEKGEFCERLLIDVELDNSLITLTIYVTWQMPNGGAPGVGFVPSLAPYLRSISNVLVAKYVNVLEFEDGVPVKASENPIH